MTIKNIKPTSKSGFAQGYFPLNECKKYLGEGPIIYRSSWEKKFCLYCESNPAILNWWSEPIAIKYFNPMDNNYHKYFPDYVIKLVSGETYIIEVKPKSQLQKPQEPKRKTKKAIDSYKWSYEAWYKNSLKQEAAKEYARMRHWTGFIFVTEDFFK